MAEFPKGRALIGLVALLAAVLLVGAVVLSPNLIPGGLPGKVRVTQVEWSGTVTGNSTSGGAQCLTSLPTYTPGAVVGVSNWILVTLIVAVDPAYSSSCYFFGASVQPSTFQYVNVPGAWTPLAPGYHLTLNVSTPSSTFGPAPIQITMYTSTTPGCANCP